MDNYELVAIVQIGDTRYEQTCSWGQRNREYRAFFPLSEYEQWADRIYLTNEIESDTMFSEEQ